jgi:hypothetical protein
MSQSFSHPHELTSWPFGRLRHALAHAGWSYAIALPDDCEIVDPGEAPDETAPTRSIGCFRWADGRAEVEVLGHRLSDEIDAADWLEHELARGGRTVVSRRPTAAGVIGVAGDVLAIWSHEGTDFIGRYAATKWGPRLFVVCFRTTVADYPDLANDALAVCASFEPLEETPGVLAEDVATAEASDPVRWSTKVPASWMVAVRPPEEEGSWLDASHISSERGAIDGRMIVAVLLRSAAKRPRDAANVALNALRDGGIAIDPAEFVDEKDSLERDAPWIGSWSVAMVGKQDQAEADVRCRVMAHDSLWVVGASVGPTKDADARAWMRNKRALDLATKTLEVAP